MDLLGGPGTGKGTQCSRLTKEFGFKHLSVGDLLRDEVKKGKKIGKQCAELMDEGKLVPVKISLGLLKNAMKESNSQRGFLIDGFPRACNQARAFEKQVLLDSLLNGTNMFLLLQDDSLLHSCRVHALVPGADVVHIKLGCSM